jgi:hypothetical protein
MSDDNGNPWNDDENITRLAEGVAEAAPSSFYQRQQSIKLVLPKSVAVIGCGGVGSWVGLFLALSGVEELWLFDHDTISEHNLNRILFRREDIGEGKAKQLGELIAKYRPDCVTYCCGMWTPEVAEGIGLNTTYVIAATDSVASRQKIYQWAMGCGCLYLEVGAEGEIGSVTGEPADFVTPAETQVGYQSVPVWLGPAVSAALMVVNYVVHGYGIGSQVLRAGWDGEEEAFTLYDSRSAEGEEEADILIASYDENGEAVLEQSEQDDEEIHNGQS